MLKVDTHRKKHQKNRVQNKKGLNNKGITFASEDQEYAQILKARGNGRFSIKLLDNTEAVGTLRGKLLNGKKNNYVESNCFVLVEYEKTTDKCKFYTINKKYSNEEEVELKKMGKLSFKVNDDNKKDDNAFVFGAVLKLDEIKDEITDLFIMGI